MDGWDAENVFCIFFLGDRSHWPPLYETLLTLLRFPFTLDLLDLYPGALELFRWNGEVLVEYPCQQRERGHASLFREMVECRRLSLLGCRCRVVGHRDGYVAREHQGSTAAALNRDELTLAYITRSCI